MCTGDGVSSIICNADGAATVTANDGKVVSDLERGIECTSCTLEEGPSVGSSELLVGGDLFGVSGDWCVEVELGF